MHYKHKLWLTISVIAVIAFFALFMVFTVPDVTTIEEVEEQETIAPGYKNKSISKETVTLSLKIDYPTFKNNGINKNLKKFINKNLDTANSFPPPDPNIPFKYKNTLEISYDQPFISEDFISVVLYVMTFTGGAHPLTTVVTKNYDAKTGKLLQLADLGLTQPKALSEIKAKVIAALMKKIDHADANWIKEGVTTKNLENFGLGPDSITFYFSPYAVAPYAAGIQKVKIKKKI